MVDLNPGYGENIHWRLLQSLQSSANNLVLGSSRKLTRIAMSGTVNAYYVRKLDGLTWKEDFNLVATSVLWSVPPLVANLAMLGLAPVMTFLSGISLLLSAPFSSAHSRHGANWWSHTVITIAQSIAVMTLGTIAMTLSSAFDIIRAIPIVGHLLRMIYKLIDGQYNNPPRNSPPPPPSPPSLPPAAAALTNPPDDKAVVAIRSDGSGVVMRLPTRVIARASLSERVANQVVYPGLNFFFSLFEVRQPAEAKGTNNISLEELARIYETYSEALTDMSCGHSSLQEQDLLILTDLMSALHTVKECQAGNQLGRFFNSQSGFMHGSRRVNSIDFISRVAKTPELFKKLKTVFTDKKDTLIQLQQDLKRVCSGEKDSVRVCRQMALTP